MAMKEEEICRVCMVECKRRYNALEDVMRLDSQEKSVTYAVAYTSCTQLEAKIGSDGLPEWLCKSCSCDLKRAYEFRLKAKESYEKLSKQIGHIKQDVKETEGAYEFALVDKYEAVVDANTRVGMLEACADDDTTDSEDPLENYKNNQVVKSKLDRLSKRQKSPVLPPTDSIPEKPTKPLTSSLPDTNDDSPMEDFDVVDKMQSWEEFSDHSFSFDGSNDIIKVHKDSSTNERMNDPTFSAKEELFSKGQKKCSICEHTYFTTIGLEAHMEVHQVKAHNSRIRKSYKKAGKIRPDTEVFDLGLKNETENNLHLATDLEKSAIDESEEIKVHKVGRKKSTPRKQKDPQQAKIPKSKPPDTGQSNSKQIWACELCDKSYTSKHSLNHHMRAHTGERPFECKVCGDRFICKSTLKAHQRRHTGERPYGCDVCGKRFIQHSSMMTHVKLNHMDKTLQCPHCIKKYTRKLDFDRHLLSHSGYKGFKCYLCPTEFVRQSNLEKHLRNLHPNEIDATNKEEDNSHSAGTENIKDRPFLCDLCPSRFTKQAMLSKHINQTHVKKPDSTKTEETNTNEST